MAQRRTPTMDARRYASVISHHAVPVLYERANRCSCWSLDYSGQPLSTCKACGGTGYVYLPGVVEAEGITLTGLVLNKDFNPGMGDWKMGDLIATIPFEVRRQPSPGTMFYDANPLWPVGEWDRFTVRDALFRSHESLVRGQARPGIPPERLRYSSIGMADDEVTPLVDYVLQADSVTGEVTYFILGTDFTMNGNQIVWADGAGPASGTQYSVTYWHNPVYIVYQQLVQSRDGIEGQHMPRRVVLRYRDDM